MVDQSPAETALENAELAIEDLTEARDVLRENGNVYPDEQMGLHNIAHRLDIVRDSLEGRLEGEQASDELVDVVLEGAGDDDQ